MQFLLVQNLPSGNNVHSKGSPLKLSNEPRFKIGSTKYKILLLLPRIKFLFFGRKSTANTVETLAMYPITFLLLQAFQNFLRCSQKTAVRNVYHKRKQKLFLLTHTQTHTQVSFAHMHKLQQCSLEAGIIKTLWCLSR